MKIVVDIPEILLERIKERLRAGEFSSLSSFFYCAAENQLELQESDIHIPAGGDDELHAQGQPTAKVTRHETQASFSGQTSMSAIHDKEDWQDLCHLQAYSNLIEKVESMECMPISGQNEMLWGQVNRLLPVKFACRALANLQNKEAGNPVSLDLYLNEASDSATALARQLAKLDSVHDKDRDERLSAGFPSIQRGEKELEKSKSRYRNQFLIYLRRKTGDISGALAQLGLCCVSGNRDKELFIGLSQKGVEFASLESPVIDHNRVDEVFTEAERECYYSTLIQTLPRELQAMCLLLNLVNEGATNPKELNEVVKHEWSSEWSEAVVSTQRSGLTARLKELGLMGKEKSGIQVSYFATQDGLSFLDRFGPEYLRSQGGQQ